MTASVATSDEQNSRLERQVLIGWNLLLVGVFLSIGLFFTPKLYQSRNDAEKRHAARMNPVATEPGTTPADLSAQPADDTLRVISGIYVDRISSLEIHDARWQVDFQIWFRWRVGGKMRPDDQIQIVDGTIDSIEKLVDREAGEEHYSRYRIAATITKSFDASRFPTDNHLLTINIENAEHLRSQMIFVADKDSTGISSRVKIPAYQIVRSAIIEKPHSYSTTLGDPLAGQQDKATFSQLRLGIWIERPSWGFFFKIFQALYVSVSIACLTFFIKPTNVDPRFGLGMGGLFAAVANNYVSSSLIPDTGDMTLADTINFLGILTIFLTVLQSTVSLYIYEKWNHPLLSMKLDRWSFAIIAVAYPLLNILLPWVAGG